MISAPTVFSSINSIVKSQKEAEFNQLLKEWEDAGTVFFDNEFPANIKSLLGFNGSNKSGLSYNQYRWARASEIFNGKMTMFDDISSNCIRQGDLGDCFLLCAIAAIAEFPARIRHLFISDKINKIGLYLVELCISGVWQSVYIDDSFPFNHSSKEFAFCQTKTNEIWVMLLEKAYAKVYGGYDNIHGGTIDEALHELTGAPTKFIFIKDKLLTDQDWLRILEAERNGFIMGCCTGNFTGTGNDRADDKTGLSGSHAYTLIGAYELVSEGSRQRLLRPGEPSSAYNERVLKLRNPWGHTEWKGKFSDGSSFWTPQLEQELDYRRDQDDGTFFMSVSDFQRYFVEYQICYFHDHYSHASKTFWTNPSDETVISFSVTSPGLYYISIIQPNARQFSPEIKYQYSPLSIFLVKPLAGGGFEYVGHVSDSYREMFVRRELEQGTYLALILTPWTRQSNEFAFCTYGPGLLESTLVPSKQNPHLATRLKEAAVLGWARGDELPIQNFGSHGFPQVFLKFDGQSEPLRYVYFKNQSPETLLTAVVSFPQMEFAEVLAPFYGRNCEVVVEPGKEAILLYRTQPHQSRVQLQVTANFTQRATGLGPRPRMDVKAEGIHQVRLDRTGRDVGVHLWTRAHDNGVDVLYENASRGLTLYEDVFYEMKNCRIEGLAVPTYRATVPPGGSFLVKVIKVVQNAPFDLKIVRCTYEIV